MSLYRAKPKDGVAWITGASTGIGRALARELASEGYTVAATARDEDRLATLVEETAQLPGKILPFPCDVTDESAMRMIATAIERDAGPIVLAIFNAGTYFPTRGERLDVLNIVKTYEINMFGVFYGLVPVVEHMRARAQHEGWRRVEVRLCGERSVELPRASIDLAFVCDTYHHFEYPRTTLASLHEALAPGGRLVVVDFERVPGKSREWVLDHVRADKQTFGAEIVAAGFEPAVELDVHGLEENYVLSFRRP